LSIQNTSSIVIEGSFNVSSITRTAAGNYNVTFASALASLLYICTTGFQRTGANPSEFIDFVSLNTTSVILRYYCGGSQTDGGNMAFMIY